MTRPTPSDELRLYGDPQHEESVRTDATEGALYGDPQHEVGWTAASDFELAAYDGGYSGDLDRFGGTESGPRTPDGPTDASVGVSA